MQQRQGWIKIVRRGCKETQGMRTDMSLSATQWCRKESEGLGTNNSWTRGWYLGQHRKKNDEGKWLGNFQPNRKKSAHLGKWQRERQPKTESKNVRFRSLEGRMTKGQLSKDAPKRKVNVRVSFSSAHWPKNPGPNSCGLVDWTWFTATKELFKNQMVHRASF